MELVDYKCNQSSNNVINEDIISGSKISFPNAHCNYKEIIDLAKLKKDKNNDKFCILPFCHTLEAEAMGGNINLGDEKNGPRVNKFVCNDINDLLKLEDIDFNKGRINEVLKAGKELRNEGEEVILMISGPFTILNSLINPIEIYKTFKKSPKVMQKIFNKLQKEILYFVKAANKNDIRVISYADSSGGLNILGPKFFSQTLDMFTVETLKKMSSILGDDSLIHLCPKISLGLVSSQRAKWGRIELESNLNYRNNLINFVGKTDFVGETCLKNNDYNTKDKILKTILLKN